MRESFGASMARDYTRRRRWSAAGNCATMRAVTCPVVPQNELDLQSAPDHRANAGRVESVHDLCLVCGGAGELGHCAVRVPDSGAGQSHRLHAVEPRATEDIAGNYYADPLRAIRGHLHEPAGDAGFLWAGLCLMGAVYFISGRKPCTTETQMKANPKTVLLFSVSLR